MRNIIYGLRDPRNDVYCYIGKSTVDIKRPLSHLTKSHSLKVNEWVSSLEENWLYPKIDIIEEIENIDDLNGREKYWINYYHALNPELLNIQSVPDIINTRSDDDEKIYESLQQNVFKIPEILRRERMYRKLTQTEMAKHIGISRSTISEIENNHNVRFDLIQRYFLTLKGFDILTKVKSDRAKR